MAPDRDPDFTVEASLRRTTAARPQALAARDLDGRSLTYAQLDTATGNLAAELDALPSVAGWITATLPNSVDAMVAAFGVLRSRHALVFVHPGLPDASQKAVRARLRPAADLVPDGPSIRVAPAPVGEPHPLWDSPRGTPELRIALAVLTSGTTGIQRAVMAPHGQVRAACVAIAARLHYGPDDVVAVVPPLSFDFGLYQLFLAVYAGATVVLDSRLASAHGTAYAIARTGVTVLPVVPSALRALSHPRLLGGVDTHAVRLITTTGDLLTEADIVAAAVAFPGAAIVPMYGISECKRVAISPPAKARPTGAVGRPLDGVDVAVGGPCAPRLRNGESGDLVVAGPLLTLGYHEDAAGTALRFGIDPRSGVRVLRTGDRLHLDDDGWLHWHGRGTDVIKTSGFRVDPAQIERAARDSGVVLEAAVYGRQDAARGQVPVLVGRVESDAEPATARTRLLGALQVTLPSWAMPEVELRTEALPRTANDKLDRAALGAPAAAGPEPEFGSTRLAPLGALRPVSAPRRLINCHTQAMLSAFALPYDVSPVEFELLTTVPFGVRCVPADPTRLLIPLLDPDVGLDRACALLGLEIETMWRPVSEPLEAFSALRHWLATGPVVLGPLDLGELTYHPAAATLRGCDHYVVALGHDDRAGFMIRDPEGMALVQVEASTLSRAWAAVGMPEGRGAFTMRRLRLNQGAGAVSPPDLPIRLAAHMLANLAAAAEHREGGAGAWESLTSVHLDATNRRSLTLLLPSAATRYRLAARLCERVLAPASVPGERRLWEALSAVFDQQAHGVAGLHRIVATESPGLPLALNDAAGREAELTMLASRIRGGRSA